MRGGQSRSGRWSRCGSVAAATDPGRLRPQPGLDGAEHLRCHDLAREELRAVRLLEVVELEAAGEAGTATALGLHPVTGGAAEAGLERPFPDCDGRPVVR